MKPRIGLSGYPRTVETVLGATVVDSATRFYIDSVVRAGGVPLVLPVVDPEDVPDLLAGVDGLVVTGGGDVDPRRYGCEPAPEVQDVSLARDDFDCRLIEVALDWGLPVLATCRGMQVLNVALGGSLVQHLAGDVGKDHRVFERYREGVHGVRVDPQSQLAQVLSRTQLAVNSLHHQAVDRPAPTLRAVAWADDGVIESVEQEGNRRLVAVQWHPELMEDSPVQQRLFRHLVQEATFFTRMRRRPWNRLAPPKRVPRRPQRCGP